MGIPLEDKASAYLCTGKVTVYQVEGWYASATVEGTDLYQVVLRGNSATQDSCSCKAGQMGIPCSHILAVRMITNLSPMPHERPRIPMGEQTEFNRLLGITGVEVSPNVVSEEPGQASRS